MEWLTTWWGSLDLFTQILYCVSIPSTLILLIQTVLIIMGFGDGGPDVNLSDTSGIDLPDCDCGMCDVTDVSDVGGDIANPADIGAMHLFTFQGIVTFLCVFSWASILTYMGCGLIPVALIVGFVLGAAAMFGVAKIIQLMGRLAQNGNIVAGIVANELCIAGSAVVERHSDGIGTVHHVVVGEDIAVVAENEAGAGGGRSGLIAPEIGGNGCGDANGGVYICRINLCRGHQLAGVNLGDVNDGVFPETFQNSGNIGLGFGGLVVAQ